ncbi:hypothetical protein [Desulfonatronum parangueonense]
MTETPASILKWKYEQILNEMLLLQSHLNGQDPPCESESEMCVRKHLLIIEVNAREAIPLETNEELQKKLRHLAIEAKMKRNAVEKKLSGEDQGLSEDDSEWVRAWRNQIVEDQGLAENHSEWARAWRQKLESRGVSESE